MKEEQPESIKVSFTDIFMMVDPHKRSEFHDNDVLSSLWIAARFVDKWGEQCSSGQVMNGFINNVVEGKQKTLTYWNTNAEEILGIYESLENDSPEWRL